VLFGAYAYLMFTLDRILLLCVKQGIGILEDLCCQNLMALYDAYRTPGKRFPELSYRISARTLLGEDNRSLFCIECQGEDRERWMRVRYISGERDDEESESRLSLYIQQFVSLHGDPSERFVELQEFLENHISVEYNRECRTCERIFGGFRLEKRILAVDIHFDAWSVYAWLMSILVP